MSDRVMYGQHLSDETLSERLDRHLAVEEPASLDAHLATCQECAARYAGLQATRQALRVLSDVGPVPDFRLDPHGVINLPQHASRKRVQEHSFVGWLAIRAVSAAVTLCGMWLIAVALLSSVPLPSAAPNSTVARSQTTVPSGRVPTCDTVKCPTVFGPDQHHTSPTTLPTYGTTLVPAPGTSTPSANDTNPLIPLSLGGLLLMGGMIGYARARPRR